MLVVWEIDTEVLEESAVSKFRVDDWTTQQKNLVIQEQQDKD